MIASPPARGPAPPQAWRDPWAWLAALAVLPLLIRSWGAPFGEPVAEDFDFLQPALFDRSWHLLDGGGSQAYWRPLSLQLYYRAFANLMLTHPEAMAAIHALALALAALLLYRALGTTWRAPAAFAAASFPLLAESTRQLIAWPDHSSDVGVFLFSALALHEASRRRLPGALAALLAALLCKEIALVTALLLPFLPAPSRRAARERLRWVAAVVALLGVWGLASLWVRGHAHLLSPQALVGAAEAQASLALKFLWAAWGSVRAMWSLSLVSDRRDVVAEVLMLTIALAAVTAFARGGAARQRLRAAMPWFAWGGAWFLLASAALTTIYPHWLPNRSQFGSVGFGIAAAAVLEAAHPALLAALVAGRIALLALSPGPTVHVAEAAPQSGAFVDFARLTRLQRLMRDTRTVLRSRHPTLPAGATVVWHFFPLEAEYAFGGPRALRAWYRDSTLQWMRFSDYSHLPEPPPAAIVEYQPDRAPQVALVDPPAMRALIEASGFIRGAQWDSARVALDRAQAFQSDSNAAIFVGQVLSKRALCQLNLDALAAAEQDAAGALGLWPRNPDSRYVLARVWLHERRLDEAAAQLDTLLAEHPDDRGAAALRDSVRAARAPVLR